MSATAPNPEDLAAFLHAPPRARFVFGPEHRPVPLALRLAGAAPAPPPAAGGGGGRGGWGGAGVAPRWDRREALSEALNRAFYH